MKTLTTILALILFSSFSIYQTDNTILEIVTGDINKKSEYTKEEMKNITRMKIIGIKVEQISWEMTASTNGSTFIDVGTSRDFGKKTLRMFASVSAGDKISIDIKVKNKAGVISSLVKKIQIK
jgi:hypothetical protein